MTTKYYLKLEQLDLAFVEKLKKQHVDGQLEITIYKHQESVLFNEAEFWFIIGLLDWSKAEEQAILTPAVEHLSSYPIESIYQFHEVLSEKLYHLDGEQYAAPLRQNDFLAADGFLHTRCCVVANGKIFYESVLEDPEKMPRSITFEPLLSLASEAFLLKTGRDDYSFIPKYDYKTYGNKKNWE